MQAKQEIILFTNKHPQWRRVLLSWLKKDEKLDVLRLKAIFLNLIKNKQRLKEDINIDYVNYLLKYQDQFDSYIDILEIFDDKIQEILHLKKKENFIKSLKTKSYSNLFNEKIEKEINTILDNKISISALKHQFFNKLARFKSDTELLEALIEFKLKNIGWTKKDVLNVIRNKKLDINIMDSDENTLLIQVNDYQACAELGSQAWCIVYNEEYFNHYIEKMKRQFIYLDFNLDIENINSTIGLTVNLNGCITDAYIKDDSPLPTNHHSSFKIDPFTKQDISDFLDTCDHEDALDTICELGLIDFYDFYATKTKNEAIRSHRHLYTASTYGQTKMVKHILLNPKINPSHNENMILKTVVVNKYTDIVKLLINDNRFQLKSISEIICFAAKGNSPEIIKLILNIPDIDPSIGYNKSLIYACENKNIEILNLLLKHPKVRPSQYSNAAIRAAVKTLDFDIIKLILDNNKIDPLSASQAALDTMVKYEELDLLKSLLGHHNFCSDVNKNITLIHAIEAHNLSALNVLLEYGTVDPSLNDNQALRIALANNYLDIVERLLKCKKVDVLSQGLNHIKTAIIHENMSLLYMFLGNKDVCHKINQYLNENAFNDHESTMLSQVINDLS